MICEENYPISKACIQLDIDEIIFYKEDNLKVTLLNPPQLIISRKYSAKAHGQD